MCLDPKILDRRFISPNPRMMKNADIVIQFEVTTQKIKLLVGFVF